MKKYWSVLILVVGLFTSCSDDCKDAKSPEAPSFFVELIDATSGENVFANGSFAENQVVVLDSEENDVSFSIITDLNVIHIVPEYKNLTSGSVVVKLNNLETMETKTVDIQFDINKVEQECFTMHTISNVVTPNNETELVNSVYIIKI
ncbi:hypothetical protein ACFS5J_12975 [Flavobacterium chuncheonense]|uniref:Lipoprotein n=1 Tax=Flavobacterium chuncheonense TaxID=2026653 RepID=A0ABW5YPE7_9FLAO